MNTLRIALLAGGLTLLASGCSVSKTEFEGLQARVYGVETRQNNVQQHVEQMSTQVNRSSQQLAAMEQTKGSAASMWADMDALRAKVSTLEGQVDSLSRQNQSNPQTAEQVARLDAEVKAIRTALSSQLGVTVEPVAAPAAEAGAAGSAAAGGAAGGATGAATGAAVTGAAAGAAGGAVESAPQASAAPAAQAAAPAAGGDPAKALFDKGYEAYSKGDYKTAQSIFGEFGTAYPSNGLAPSAKFWEGESFFQQKDYPNAILRYEDVIKKGKSHPRYKSAMLKEGIAFINMGKADAGKARLKQLTDEAGDSPEGKRAKAILQGARP